MFLFLLYMCLFSGTCCAFDHKSILTKNEVLNSLVLALKGCQREIRTWENNCYLVQDQYDRYVLMVDKLQNIAEEYQCKDCSYYEESLILNEIDSLVAMIKPEQLALQTYFTRLAAQSFRGYKFK